MKILLKFLRENKRLFFFTLFFLLLQTICILLIPFFTEEIVDHGIAGGSIDTVLSIALKMIVSSVIGVIVSITCTYLTAVSVKSSIPIFRGSPWRSKRRMVRQL